MLKGVRSLNLLGTAPLSVQAAQAHSREPEPPSAEELRGIKPRGGDGEGGGEGGEEDEEDGDAPGPKGNKPETAAAKFMRERELKRACWHASWRSRWLAPFVRVRCYLPA